MQYLYACLFSNGHVKVGRSINPQSRIATHEARVLCVGIELVEHHFAECISHVVQAEKSLIARCQEQCTTSSGEWFAGLDFQQVIDWLHTSSESNFASYKGMNEHAAKIIEALGDTAEVSRLFDVRMPSVSDWKKTGIPKARMMYLQVARPDVLKGIDIDAATAPVRAPSKEAA